MLYSLWTRLRVIKMFIHLKTAIFIFYGFAFLNGFTIGTTSSTIDTNSANTTVVCPLNLTANLPCICHVLNDETAVEIICNNTQPDKVWNALGGYSANINKIAFRNCPNITDTFGPIPGLKIRSLDVTNCMISQLHPAAFDSLADLLEELWLVNDSLTSIPKLGKLKKLRSLNLNANILKDFPDLTLSGLKELKQLRLSKNQICMIMNPLFDQKATLDLLDLSQNCLNVIPALALRSCMELKYLSLAGNNLKEITSMQFMSLPKLIELRLQGNKLERVMPNGFMNVPALQMLFMHNNLLSSFDPGTLQAFKELQLIDLSSNAFLKIPLFKDMAQLFEVRLDNNKIDTIETLTFSGTPNLKIISLANNQIGTIARNSFDAQEQLEHLNLADNFLTTIERGMLEGMRHLKDLNLRNNTISELNRHSFTSSPELISLDLSHNQLKTLRNGTFTPFQRLHLLKLDNNEIEAIENGTFEGKIDTILLDGNNLRCDQQLDWFIDWLVKNKIRTFVPNQPEIKCALPLSKKGMRLKDLMMQKNNLTNEVLSSLHNVPGIGTRSLNGETTSDAGNLLANLIPGLTRQAQGAQLGSQMLNSLAQTFPELRYLPGMKFVPNTFSSTTANQPTEKSFDSAIDQFSEPLVKFASGVQPSPADVNRLLESIPSLVVNVPGLGNVDVSKLNPSMVEYVLKGGQIPGIPRETLDNIVKQYMQRLYAAAAQAQGRQTTDVPPLPNGINTTRMLRPISELPLGLVQNVMDGKPLPHLTTEQTNVIKEYYTQHAPVGDLAEDDNGSPMNVTDLLPKNVVRMMQLLPRNYNLSNLPPELVRQVMRGEMPDLTKLPLDLQQHIKDNFDRLISSLENAPDLDIKDILAKLPTFEQPTLVTFSPYDINTVDADLVVKEKKSQDQARFWRLCAAVALGLAGAITLGVLSAFCWYWRRTRGETYEAGNATMSSASRNERRVLPPVVREQSFRPSASSTLK